MAYLIFYSHGVEFDRRPLPANPVYVGRGTDCELAVHDILLSRRHFRLTPTTDGWLLIDLRSRNGTRVNGKVVEQQMLKENDILRAGKTAFRFRTGSLDGAARRPATPPVPIVSASDSTAVGWVVKKTAVRMPVSPVSPAFRMASPKPRPRDPDSFADTGVYALLDQIVSSSWDSTYQLNARPLPRTLPRAAVTTARDIDDPVQIWQPDTTPQSELPIATVVKPQGRQSTAPRMTRLRRFVRSLRSLRLF